MKFYPIVVTSELGTKKTYKVEQNILTDWLGMRQLVKDEIYSQNFDVYMVAFLERYMPDRIAEFKYECICQKKE